MSPNRSAKLLAAIVLISALSLVTRVSIEGTKSEVAANRLSFQRVRQFEKLVRTHVKPFDRLSYPASEAESQ
ncbi:MAG: hypothetical protein H7126_07485 [Candidatus Parcubacteria bacterium]|uniref:hypothetical protein n=1 Tax=Phormidesmis priestleyi TaxID=268141 RepID=UPI00083A3DD5|nr:hypothetical protein [Phormidesmis priestleyi]MBC7823709.1 hypothetical protein [Leptolyngbyaceae cyanobacterium LF-bin-113]